MAASQVHDRGRGPLRGRQGKGRCGGSPAARPRPSGTRSRTRVGHLRRRRGRHRIEGAFGLFYGRRKTRPLRYCGLPRTFERGGAPAFCGNGRRVWVIGASPRRSTRATGASSGVSGITVWGPGMPGRWKKSAAAALGEARRNRAAQETHRLSYGDEPRRRGPDRSQERWSLGRRIALLYALGTAGRSGPTRDRRTRPSRKSRPATASLPGRGLRASRPPSTGGASVEIRPSTKRTDNVGKRDYQAARASEVRAVRARSCLEFAGPAVDVAGRRAGVHAGRGTRGRRVARLGAEVAEPWRI